MSDLVEGRLIRIEPRAFTVDVDGREIPCSLKPKLFTPDRRAKTPVAVGDRVKIRIEGERGVIDEVLPRRNALLRPGGRGKAEVQITAVNVDQLLIVVATKDPPPRAGLIDRYLIASERNGMDAVLVINKCDQGVSDELRAALARYEAMGYAVCFTSAIERSGIDALIERLRDKTSLFVGHSGVGKSSLLNAIDPTLQLATGGLAKHGRGRHTTTSVSLTRLACGGHLIDSPGIRAFGLHDIPKGELALLMPDLRPYASDCKYSDCSHDHEPGCALRAAVERGEVPRARYDGYVRILHSLDGGDGGDEDDDGPELR